jgi:hypothetical protein
MTFLTIPQTLSSLGNESIHESEILSNLSCRKFDNVRGFLPVRLEAQGAPCEPSKVTSKCHSSGKLPSACMDRVPEALDKWHTTI